MCVAQVGQNKSGCVGGRPGATQHHQTLRRNCVSAAVTSGSWVCVYSDRRLLQREDALLLEAEKAAGEWRTGVSDMEPACLDGGLCSEPSVFGDGNLCHSTETVLREVCIG